MNKGKLSSQHLKTAPETISIPYQRGLRRDTKARDILNRVLGTSFVNVWTTDSVYKSKGHITIISGGLILCLRENGIVVKIFTNELLDIEVY